MTELREVFEMVTKQAEPDVDAWKEQEQRQRRTGRNRRVGALTLAAAIGIVAAIVVIRAVDDGTGAQPGGEGTDTSDIPTTRSIPTLPGGSVEPGRYVFSSSDSELDSTYEITIEVPDGYSAVGESAVLKDGSTQTSISTLTIRDVYVDPCRWLGGETLDRSAISSADALVAALSTQEGLRVSGPTAVMVNGFAGTYLERRVPNSTDVTGCDLGQFHLYGSVGWGDRWLDSSGQLQRLWIVDVDGVPLVIDATTQPETSPKTRAELVQMVDSIQIDPR